MGNVIKMPKAIAVCVFPEKEKKRGECLLPKECVHYALEMAYPLDKTDAFLEKLRNELLIIHAALVLSPTLEHNPRIVKALKRAITKLATKKVKK